MSILIGYRWLQATDRAADTTVDLHTAVIAESV